MEGVLRKFTTIFRGNCREDFRETITTNGYDYPWEELGVDLMQGQKDNISLHRPVLLAEVLGCLNLSPGKVIVDCTVGGGGHAEVILEKILPGGFLVGIDRDTDALGFARKRLNRYRGCFQLVHGNFKDIELILRDTNVSHVDGFLFDLGLSSYQLFDIGRGFSFRSDGPLDMRVDRAQKLTAYNLVNHLDEDALVRLLQDYAQERFAKSIARQIILSRKRKNIHTTTELVGLILKAMPRKHKSGRLHPATRTFQALRIAVNNELENLSSGLDNALNVLSKGGRLAVISFHSLEDRIAKNKLRHFAKENRLILINRKPIVPSRAEVLNNPRARSAKLRIAEKI